MTSRIGRQYRESASHSRLGMASVAILSLALCSCRSPLHPSGLAPAAATPPCPAGEECMPAVAEVAPMMAPMMPQFAPTPLPYEVQGAWAPPGIALPWPEDEYVRDGGDDGPPVMVSPDWQVYNLEMEDTVAHFDTEDGRTLIEASNKVNVYAPCFGAVRTVTRLAGNEQTQPPLGVDNPMRIARHDEALIPASSLQREQAERQAAMKGPELARTYQGEGVLGQAQIITAFQDAFLPYENFTVLRTGQFANNEKARLATAVQAAITWTADQGAQVVIDNRAAQVVEGDRRAQATYMVENFKKPKLRVIKVASTQTACCGETIDFTIRFDNIGTQVLGNVVVLDNLSPRLEYVPDSAQSSVETVFSVEPNSGNSLVLRWEIDKPIEPGDGGVVRFRCVVR
jgi:uncharacterized repeat protein (TIGR01451 family)